jgi:NAD(P)-dependent dehydrogenase (short-subunit alcohol dehydrogenase family)
VEIMVWLITGCSAGFGREFALAAVEAGEQVMATARNPAQLADLAGHDLVRTTALDVTDEKSIEAAVATTLDQFGRIDVLVNNAGYGAVGALEEMDLADFRHLMEVMYFGAAALTKAVLPHLRAQGGGAIVQISSVGGVISPAGYGGYCAAKFALEGLSEALAAEVRPFGIKVLIVEPGAFRTEFGGDRLKRAPEMPEYRESTAGSRGAVATMDGTQQGDPKKAIQVVRAMLGSDDLPLRLPLGADAVDGVRAHHQQQLADLARFEALSRSTDL